MEIKSRTYTYQTRLDISSIDDNVLSFLKESATYFSMIERKLYADYRKGKDITKLKSEYLLTYGITARQFNAIRIILQGKIKSVLALQKDYIKDTEAKISKLTKTIKHLQKTQFKTKKQLFNLHQKQRALLNQQNKLKQLKLDQKNKTARITFGSKRLFNKQFYLEDNNYDTHLDWKQDWIQSRSKQFYLIGSKDETMGNQSAIASLNADGSFGLKIRVPKFLEDKYGKYINLDNITFDYGIEEIVKAIQSNIKRNNLQRNNSQKLHGDLYKQYGLAINYRFLQDNKGWRIFVTVEQSNAIESLAKEYGTIGVDINQNHLAITEINHTGNIVNTFNINTNTYGKNQNQAKAIIGDAIKQLVDYAKLKNKSIVIERLDFANKKRELSNNADKLATKSKKARLLSSFSYSAIINMLLSRAFRFGIEVHQVNPAYSSIIGRVKFASQYKISVHQAAALVIARRILGFSERLPKLWNNIPDNTGSRVTLPQLEKIEDKHVWSSWAKVLKNLKTVLAAQYQMRKSLLFEDSLTLEDAFPF